MVLAFGIGLNAKANPNQNSPLGMNTNEALEVDASLPFVDLFRLSLPFDEARPWYNTVYSPLGNAAIGIWLRKRVPALPPFKFLGQTC